MVSMVVKGVKEAKKTFAEIHKQTVFATAVALTKTAKDAKNDLARTMERSFRSPKPFTRKAVYVKTASKQNLESRVGLKPIAAGYLIHQIKGVTPRQGRGRRRVKGVERVLRSKGFLGSSEFIVPGRDVRLDRYGNISRKKLQDAIRWASIPGAKYFYTERRRVKGIWERYGAGQKKIRPFLVFVRKPMYEARFDFYGSNLRTYERKYQKWFDQVFNRAISQSLVRQLK